MTTATEARPCSALELLGAELMADIAARVAAAPAPSPQKLAEVRRLFAAAQLPK